jgi:hypothetical protein
MTTDARLQEESALVDEDLPFHHRQWRVQRLAWWIVSTIPLLGLVGLCGGGPMSARVTHRENNEFHYERFARRRAATKLEIIVASDAAAGETVRVRFADSYLRTMEVESLVPSPSSVRAQAEYTEFNFPRASGASASVIRFELQPESWGRVSGQLRVDDLTPVVLRTFVWP